MQGSYWGMALYIFLEYLAGASYHNFVPLFFEEKGFSLGQISILIGVGPLVAVMMQPLWGIFSDRVRTKNLIHRLALLGACGTIWLFAPAASFVAMLGAVAAFGAFSTSITPLGETILLEHLEREGRSFGPLRVWGTLSFAVGAQLMGVILEGHLERFVWATAGWFALAAAASFGMPRVAGHQCGRKKQSWKPLLQKRTLLWLLLLVAVLQLTQGLSFSFFSLYFTGTLGASKKMLGVAALIAALAEVPFLLLGDRLLARFGARKLVLCAGVVMGIRWALVSVLRSATAVMVTQALNGFGLIVLTFCVVKTIQQTVPEALKSSGQMLASVVTFGFGRGLVGPVGWLLARVLEGIAPIFMVMAALCATAVLCIGLPLLRMSDDA